MSIGKIVLTIVLIVGGMFGAIKLNYGWLERMIIPDKCYYHNHDYKTTKLFDLLYSFPPDEGGHPAPTGFNFIFTLIIGGVAGWVIANFINKKLFSN